MATYEVLVFPDDRLRKHAKDVTVFDDELKQLAADMFETMYQHEGVGLAAPQIGISKRLVVIDPQRQDEQGNVIHDQLVLVNPEIFDKQGEETAQEGCLSVPGYYENVTRASEIDVRYQDLDGRVIEMHADGFLAICIQHEVDHLFGHLFIDYLSSMKRQRIEKKIAQKQRDAKHQQNHK